MRTSEKGSKKAAQNSLMSIKKDIKNVLTRESKNAKKELKNFIPRLRK